MDRAKNRYFLGHLFTLSGIFWPVWVSFHDFRAPFFPFLLFSDFRRRYTRTEDGRLMYSPSGMKFEAPQLGPQAYRFLFCVFGP
jgi:hypothetical protein